MCSVCHAVLLLISSCCCLCLHTCVISAVQRDSEQNELNNTLDSIESLVTDEERGLDNPFIDDQATEVREESATPDRSTEEEDTSSSEVDGRGVASKVQPCIE